VAKKKSVMPAPASGVEHKIEGFAEDLGKLLGTAQAKASSWLDQRKSIAEQLTQIRDTANDYLQRLSGEASSVIAAVQRGRRRGRPPGSRKKTGGYKAPAAAVKGKRKGGMSAAGRAAVAAAQKARWAKIRAEKAKAGRGADK
jgi:hypothetical protein